MFLKKSNRIPKYIFEKKAQIDTSLESPAGPDVFGDEQEFSDNLGEAFVSSLSEVEFKAIVQAILTYDKMAEEDGQIPGGLWPTRENLQFYKKQALMDAIDKTRSIIGIQTQIVLDTVKSKI